MAGVWSESRPMSSMSPMSVRSSSLARRRSYGIGSGLVQVFARTFVRLACAASLALLMLLPGRAADAPVRVVALGDSLTAGYGLPVEAAFPTRLEGALRAKGLAVEINNAGVSGDTSSGGLARLDWSVPEGTDGVIVELGANDMLRGVDPGVTRGALQDLLRRLKERRIAVLLTGMRAPPNMGQDYARAFDAIFPAL